jgi:hypothetical protein
MLYNLDMRIAVLVFILGLMGHAVMVHASDVIPLPDANACLPGITSAEREFGLPPKLLHTIGIVESGRADPATGRVIPWPWTIDVAGTGHMYATKAAAIAAVRDLQSSGIVSIDVGCMQINLMHHPDAFASLDEAFDPWANTRYGARFLSALYRETGNWPQAAAAYHSRTPDIGASYEMRVMSLWPLAERFPDATLRRRSPAMAQDEDLSHYTPAFAARVKQIRADAARLATIYAPINPRPHQWARTGGTDRMNRAAVLATMADSE